MSNVSYQQLESVEFGMTVIPVQMSNEKVVKNLDCYILGWKSSSVSLLNFYDGLFSK